MNSLKAMYGCGLNFFIKLAYNSLFYISLQCKRLQVPACLHNMFYELHAAYG